MQQSVEFKIDYLTITNPSLELSGENEVAMTLYDFDSVEKWESFQAPRPYRYGVKNAIGAIGGSAHKGQGTILSWSGSALMQSNAVSIAELAILNKWKITRLDATMDFFGFDTTVEDYKQEYLNGQANTIARSWDERRSSGDGHTFYIGSYHSTRFMRIYNKTASEARFTDITNLPDKWVRCELKLGDEHARSAFGFISSAGINAAIPALLRGYADFPNITEYVGVSSYPISTIGAGKKATNTKHWLMETVLPSLVKELRLDPEFAQDWFDRLTQMMSEDK